jgi:hypothetical protein
MDNLDHMKDKGRLAQVWVSKPVIGIMPQSLLNSIKPTSVVSLIACYEFIQMADNVSRHSIPAI